MNINTQPSSPGHTARLAAAAGVPINKRVLAYHEPPPPSSSDPLLSQQRELVRPLYARPGALPSSTGFASNKSRKIPTEPERVLDAPGIVDDFYLNLVAWGSLNMLAVALEAVTYIWNGDTGEAVQLGEAPEGSYLSSLDFSADGQFLGIGLGTGEVELWDIETRKKLRTMGGHSAQVACLSWNQHILSSGCSDGSIWHHDVRIARHKVGELLGHQGEVCGLKWREDGELLASGGNDNVVNVWDGRVGDVASGSRTSARWTKRNHTAAVKVRNRSSPRMDAHLMKLTIGSRMVPLATLSPRHWWRHQRRHSAYLEHHDRRAPPLTDNALADHVHPVVAASKGVPNDARLPD
jgi:cell division cycle 20, cofactor of APC complex